MGIRSTRTLVRTIQAQLDCRGYLERRYRLDKIQMALRLYQSQDAKVDATGSRKEQ